MEQHVWEAHRLILDGLETRDPWAVIGKWLDSCKTDPEAVHEAVQTEPCGTESADALVRAGLLGLVAMVENDQPLGEEEDQKAGAVVTHFGERHAVDD